MPTAALLCHCSDALQQIHPEAHLVPEPRPGRRLTAVCACMASCGAGRLCALRLRADVDRQWPRRGAGAVAAGAAGRPARAARKWQGSARRATQCRPCCHGWPCYCALHASTPRQRRQAAVLMPSGPCPGPGPPVYRTQCKLESRCHQPTRRCTPGAPAAAWRCLPTPRPPTVWRRWQAWRPERWPCRLPRLPARWRTTRLWRCASSGASRCSPPQLGRCARVHSPPLIRGAARVLQEGSRAHASAC